MTDCQHEWVDVSLEQSDEQNLFSCLKCGHRLVAGPLTLAVIKAEQLVGLTNETLPLETADIGSEDYRSFAWNYERTYYHISPTIDLLDGVLDPIFIESPRSAQNDADVQSIVDALNGIASRMDLED